MTELLKVHGGFSPTLLSFTRCFDSDAQLLGRSRWFLPSHPSRLFCCVGRYGDIGSVEDPPAGKPTDPVYCEFRKGIALESDDTENPKRKGDQAQDDDPCGK